METTHKPPTTTFNMNDEIIIYPNEKGWRKIVDLMGKDYAKAHLCEPDMGYKDTAWVIASELHDMFFHGEDYFKHMEATLTKSKIVFSEHGKGIESDTVPEDDEEPFFWPDCL